MFKPRVFVSYHNTDQDKARFLATWLRSEGLEVFFAEDTVKYGQEFERKIEKELAKSDVFIVLISKESNKSVWVMREITIALSHYHNRQIEFFPIVIEADVEPPEIIRPIHHAKVATSELHEWIRIATEISRQIPEKRFLTPSILLLLMTVAVVVLEIWIGERLRYFSFVLLAILATFTFVWFRPQMRSKLGIIFLATSLLLQVMSIAAMLGNLRRNEFERANASALALCNAANDQAFDRLWDQFAGSRYHQNFINGLREIIDNQALSLSSKINARIALIRLEQFQTVMAKLPPDDNTTFFEFVRKPSRWLREESQLNWVFSWSSSDDARLVIWSARTLGLSHEAIKKPPFPRTAIEEVRKRLLELVTMKDNAGIVNNCLWALSQMKTTHADIMKAENAKKADRGHSLNHLGIREINEPKISLVLINPPNPSSDQRPFYLSDTEITVEQFSHFVKENPEFKSSAEIQGISSCFGSNGVWFRDTCKGASWMNLRLPEDVPLQDTINLPVVHVSWIDAVQFCNWLSIKEGLASAYELGPEKTWHLIGGRNGYRLPSIKEWQIGSQAGTSTLFWWADFAEWQGDKEWECSVANLPDASFARWKQINIIAAKDSFPFHAPVKTFTPNDWGLFETIGNVGEWGDEDERIKQCQEYSPGKKPRLGGSWGDDLQFVNSTSCRAEGADTSHVNVGFRIAKSIQ